MAITRKVHLMGTGPQPWRIYSRTSCWGHTSMSMLCQCTCTYHASRCSLSTVHTNTALQLCKYIHSAKRSLDIRYLSLLAAPPASAGGLYISNRRTWPFSLHFIKIHVSCLPSMQAPVDANESSNESLSGDSVASSSPARLHAFLCSLICAPDADPTSYPSPGRVHPWNLDSNLSPRRSALHQLAGPSAKPSFQCSAACGASNISKSDFQLDSSTSVPTSASQVLPLTAAADGCSRLSDVSQPQGAVYVYCA